MLRRTVLLGSNQGATRVVERHKRWMLFADGESLTLRTQELAEREGFEIPRGDWFKRDVYFWFMPAGSKPADALRGIAGFDSLHLQSEPIRSFYYATTSGDSDELLKVKEALWNRGFDPHVFYKLKSRGSKGKGVDITLTKDVLANAFMDNYDVAVVITNDADYVPVFNEVKRLGKQLFLLAIEDSGAKVSPDLRLSADRYLTLDDLVRRRLPKLALS